MNYDDEIYLIRKNGKLIWVSDRDSSKARALNNSEDPKRDERTSVPVPIATK